MTRYTLEIRHRRERTWTVTSQHRTLAAARRRMEREQAEDLRQYGECPFLWRIVREVVVEREIIK